MATIQGIYVALFGRPADPAGLAFFNEATNNGADLTAIGDLASTAEYQDRFTGMSNTEIVNSIYQSLFERDGEPAGVDFWVEQLESGALNINTIAIAILDGAQGDDLATVNAKIAAANIFTARLDLDEEVEAYVGDDAAQVGRDFINGVNTSTPGDAAGADAAILRLFPDEGQTPGGGGSAGGGAIGGGGVSDVTAPVFTSPTVVRVEENIGDGAEVYHAIASDAEGVVEYSLRSGASQFSIDPKTGVVTINTNPNFEDEDEYSFVVVAKDAAGNTAFQTVDLFIDDENEAPSLEVSQLVTEVSENSDRTLIAEFQVSDVDAGDAVTLSIEGDLFELDEGKLYLRAGIDFEALDGNPVSVKLIATDQDGENTSQTISVGILDVNEAPSIELDQLVAVVPENNDRTLVATVSATDPDEGDELTLSIDSEYFTLEGNDVYLNAGVDFEMLAEADLSLTVTATDLEGFTSHATLTVTITDEVSQVHSFNSTGAKTIDDFNVFEDQINVSAIDAKYYGPIGGVADLWANQAFVFGGPSETAPAFGTLVWRHVGENTIVEADNTPGGGPNLVITITGLHDLTIDHFVL